MPVQTKTIKRGGVERESTFGVTPEGGSRVFTDNLEPAANQQTIRRFPCKLVIEFDEINWNGDFTRIETSWKEGYLSAAGTPLLGTERTYSLEDGRDLKMITKEGDRKEFALMIGQVIVQAMLSGDYKANRGFDEQPVFNPDGSFNTTADTEAPPTFGYHNNPTPPEPTEPA